MVWYKKGTLAVFQGFVMARNKVQFQKGLSERRFRELYGTEAQCRAALFAWRWLGGFLLPALWRRAP